MILIDFLIIFTILMAMAILISILRIACVSTRSLLCLKLLALSFKVPGLIIIVTRPFL
jgi:hypothetical protein